MSRPRDLAFRGAELTLRDGAVASVLLPAIYHGAGDDVGLLLGRETHWSEGEPLITGLGQRCLLIGDDVVPFHEIGALSALSDEERQIARG
jgi:type VI secretion system protein ImpE